MPKHRFPSQSVDPIVGIVKGAGKQRPLAYNPSKSIVKEGAFMEALSRRTFITVSGGLTAATLVGTAATRDTARADEIAKDAEADETVSCDIVVLGSGSAGLAASIQAAELGASVVMLEKEESFGGNTAVAEGIFGVGSRMQEEMGESFNVNDMLQEEFEFHNYNVNTKLWEIIAHNSGEDLNWFMDHGVEFKTVTNPGAGPNCWHVFKDAHGTEAVANLVQAARDAGVDVRSGTPGLHLLMDGDTVVGVRAQNSEGTVIDFAAKAVILCTGGMAADEEAVVANTNAQPGRFRYLGVPGPTGDGLRMAQEAGMGRAGAVTVCNIGINVPDLGCFNQYGVCMGMEPTNLWVNEDGERFSPEDKVFLMTTAGNCIMNQFKAFSIIDQDTFDRLHYEGPILGQETKTVAGVPCDEIEDCVNDALEAQNPCVFKAGTIEELAEQMGIDPDALVATVDTYNGYVDEGNDPDYHKDPQYLVKVQTAPIAVTRRARSRRVGAHKPGRCAVAAILRTALKQPGDLSRQGPLKVAFAAT